MQINLNEKFNIVERLENLSEATKEHSELSNICKKFVYEAKSSNINMNYVLSELSTFKWVSDVENFIAEYNTYVFDNSIAITLENLANQLESSAYANTYKPVVDKLNTIIPLDESDIKSKIHELKEFTYVPQLSNIIENFERSEYGVKSSVSATVSHEFVSPVSVNEDLSYVMHIDGTNYIVEGDKIDIYGGDTSSKFDHSVKIVENFDISGNVFTLKTDNEIIKLEESEDKVIGYINDTVFEDLESFKTGVSVSKGVNYFDASTKSLLEFAFGEIKELVRFDNLRMVESNDKKFTFIKLEESISLITFDKHLLKTSVVELNSENLEGVCNMFEAINIDANEIIEALGFDKSIQNFKDSVDAISLDGIVENYDSILSEVEAKLAESSEFTDTKLAKVQESVDTLKSYKDKLTSKNVKFVLETRSKFDLSENDKRNEVIELLNNELKELVK